jgi:hypothetical protein
VRLRFCATMVHGTQKTRINPHQSSQGARIQAIILSCALANQLNIPRIRNDHFMS